MSGFVQPIIYKADDNIEDAICDLLDREENGEVLSSDDFREFHDKFSRSFDLMPQPENPNAIPHAYYMGAMEGQEKVLVYDDDGKLRIEAATNRSLVVFKPDMTGLCWVDQSDSDVEVTYLGQGAENAFDLKLYSPGLKAMQAIEHILNDHLTGRCHSCHDVPQAAKNLAP